MRRILTLTVLSLLILWLLPPLAFGFGYAAETAVTLRASSPGALVWLALTTAATLAAAYTGGALAARASLGERGRTLVLPAALITAILLILWLLVPALDRADSLAAPPLITVRAYIPLALVWFAAAATGTLLLMTTLGWRVQRLRADQSRERALRRLMREQLDEGVALLDRRMRLQWSNEVADRQIVKGDSVEAGVAQLVRRARDMGKVAAQSMTIDEQRVTVHVLPLPDGETGIVTRPQNSENSPSEFYERFMRRIVHDMRNPLAAIIAHASNLQTAPQFDKSAATRTAQTIETEAQRLTRLVDSILFDARLSHMPLVLESVDAADIMEEVYYQHDERAEKEGKTLELEMPTDPLPIEADRDLLARALSNLVDNSLKYSSYGCRVRIVGERAAQHILLKVIDDGEGIPPEYLPDRIFEAMVRVKPRDGIAGTGLGLSIVRKIAQMHGGAIQVESALGRGTTMTLVLPVGE
jgi:signal transduction histidine kinase